MKWAKFGAAILAVIAAMVQPAPGTANLNSWYQPTTAERNVGGLGGWRTDYAGEPYWYYPDPHCMQYGKPCPTTGPDFRP